MSFKVLKIGRGAPRRVRSCCGTLAVALCMAVAPLSLQAAEFFVATNGCDLADGSAAKPWRTIQRAASVAQAGDVVTIRGGIYREWVKPANAGRDGAPIVLKWKETEASASA